MGFSDNCLSAALQEHFMALTHLELETLLETVGKSLVYIIFVVVVVYQRNYHKRLTEQTKLSNCINLN